MPANAADGFWVSRDEQWSCGKQDHYCFRQPGRPRPEGTMRLCFANVEIGTVAR